MSRGTPDWKYDTAPDLEKSIRDRLQGFPRQPDLLVYGLRSLAALLLRTWLRTYHRLRIEGRDHLPADGPFILVANHTSHLDALSLISCIPLRKLHRVFPAAAADYFFTSLARSAFSAVVINALPFERHSRGAESLLVCRELLAAGDNILVLFPEGTRSPTGELGRFRSGIGRIVAGTSTPVLPCHLSGAAAAWPRGRALPRPRPLRLRIGRPRGYGHLPGDRASVEWICEDLRTAVAELGGAAAP